MSCGETKDLRMNKNDEDIDLRLALGSRNYSAQTRLHSNSGAGVNANSRVDVPFVVSDPLSELVWLPHNGLSLKRANPSLADRKPFLTWNIRESTKRTLKSQEIRLGSGDNNVSAGEKLSVSQTMLDGAASSSSEIDVNRKFSHGGSKGLIEKAVTADAKGNEEEEVLCTSQNVKIAQDRKMNVELDIRADSIHEQKSNTVINLKFPSKLIIGSHFDQKDGLGMKANRNSIVSLAAPIRSEPPVNKVSEALVCSLPNTQARQQLDDEVISASADANKTKTEAALSLRTLSLMKQESSAENDLDHLVAKEVPSSREMDFLPVERAPANLSRKKGKEKALSDVEIYEKEDSHESVESCNSAAVFPKGAKRQHYNQEQPVESKRMKKYIQGSPGPTSVIKADSSFMSWISNMVKGLPDSNKEESSLALNLAHSNNNQQESFIYNKTSDFAKPMGFQNVFQSLYCQTNKTYIAGVQKDNQFVAESNELVAADLKSLGSTPQSCNRNNDSSSKQIVLSDQEVNPDVSRSLIKPRMISTGDSSEKILVENKASDIPECSRAIVEVNSSGSFCKKVDTNGEKMNLDEPLPMSCAPEKGNTLSSLWVTRLYTRSAKLENCNPITEEATDCNSECPKESRTNDVISIGQKISEGRDDYAGDRVHSPEKEMQRCYPKDSVGFNYSLNQIPTQPSQEVRSSEIMASVFAKRLDALRHIIHPSEQRETVTCFFCGNSGHDLRKCPELTENELENILVNISSFDRADESPCLCIRCFQLDHWAISCPLASSHEHRQSKHTTSHLSRDDKCTRYFKREEDGLRQVFAGQVACKTQPILGYFPRFLNWDMKESSSKRFPTSPNLGNCVKDEQIFPPYKPFDTQIAIPEEEMFCAIRKLRLSRADILRCMNSDVSLSHLNGFFLRLRLGELEGGLGGTGYYVVCITGGSIENIDCKSKKSVLVDVCGIKSSIESQYISNHDFLEGEIKYWWSRIEKTGGKIPSLHVLKSKIEDKKCLGL